MRASERWTTLVTTRLAEMDELCPGRSATGPGFWNRRARRFAAATDGTATQKDPLYARLRRASGRRTTVLDVGSGPGRFSLALAPHVRDVVAVDHSAGMLRILAERSQALGLDNVRTVTGAWQDIDVPPADVGVCSYVLPLVRDVAPFLQKLDAHCRRRVFVYLNAASLDTLIDPMWRHFHGRPRAPGPTYLDAVAVLAELGITADVEVVEIPTRSRHDSVDAAVKAYADQLCLPKGAGPRKELRRILASWLVKDNGRFRPPLRSTPAAIISWTPDPATAP